MESWDIKFNDKGYLDMDTAEAMRMNLISLKEAQLRIKDENQLYCEFD